MVVDQSSKSTKEKSLATAYLELHRFGQNGEYDRALKTANRILNMSPQEHKAFHCKIVCLIQQSKFNEALQTMQKNPILSKEFYFEKAYCQYRQNNTAQALVTIDEVEEPDFRLKELKAQVLYRLEKFNDALDIYHDIIKNSHDDYADERETNLCASIAQLSNEEPESELDTIRTDTYELCYNWACSLIAREQYIEAEKSLRVCEKLCRDSLEEDGLSEEEIDIELALVRIQLAYVFQKQGRIKEAQQLYTTALKLKIDDSALVAVASNNMVVINKDQNVFDSKKKMKVATSEILVHKLPSKQRKWIALNHAILMYYTNQFEQCNRLCKSVESTWSGLALQARITNALSLSRIADLDKAIELLNDYNPTNDYEKLYIKLSIVHLLLIHGLQFEACKTLENMDEDSYKPGIVGALITIYLGLKKKETALAVFEKTVEWYKKNKIKADLRNMWRQAAEFHMRNGQPKIAANSLEELISSCPNDKKALAQLTLAYFQFDKKKAADLIKKLPPFARTLTESELDALESSNWITLKKTVSKLESSPGTPRSDTVEKKKRHRKHKNKLPRHYDPNIPADPERWLPKYERSGYKKKRDRRAKDVIKGSQGTTSGQADQFDFSKIPEQESQNSPISSIEPSPRTTYQKKTQQKKKNKRR